MWWSSERPWRGPAQASPGSGRREGSHRSWQGQAACSPQVGGSISDRDRLHAHFRWRVLSRTGTGCTHTSGGWFYLRQGDAHIRGWVLSRTVRCSPQRMGSISDWEMHTSGAGFYLGRWDATWGDAAVLGSSRARWRWPVFYPVYTKLLKVRAVLFSSRRGSISHH